MSELERQMLDWVSGPFWGLLFAALGAFLLVYLIGNEWSRIFFLTHLYEAVRPHVVKERELIDSGAISVTRFEQMARLLERMLRHDGVLKPYQAAKTAPEAPPAASPTVPTTVGTPPAATAAAPTAPAGPDR